MEPRKVLPLENFCRRCRQYGSLKPVTADSDAAEMLCELCRSPYLAEPKNPLSGLQLFLLLVGVIAFLVSAAMLIAAAASSGGHR